MSFSEVIAACPTNENDPAHCTNPPVTNVFNPGQLLNSIAILIAFVITRMLCRFLRFRATCVVVLTGTHESAGPRFTQPYFAPGPTHGAGDVHAIPAGETSYIVRFPAP